MSALPIQFQGLRINGETLSRSSISKQNQDKITSIISKHLSGLDLKKGFELESKEGLFSIKQENREIALDKYADKKEIEKVFKYYHNVGKINYFDFHHDDDIKEKILQKTKESHLNGQNPDLKTQSIKGLKVSEGILDQVRNFLVAIPALGLENRFLTHSGYYSGGLWTLFASLDIKNGIDGIKEAVKIEDNEGKVRSISLLCASIISFLGSLSFVTGTICHEYALKAVSSLSMGIASVLFGVGTLLALCTSILGTIRCYRFNARINEYLKDPSLNEKEKYRGILHFLKGETTVNSNEREKIVRNVNELSISAKEKSDLIREKLANLTEVKTKYVKRRTSVKSLLLIQTQIDQILEKIQNKETQDVGLEEAKALVAKVQKESHIKLSLYSLTVLASILALIATLVSLIATGGIATYIIYGVSSAIYLGLTIYSAIAYFFKGDLK